MKIMSRKHAGIFDRISAHGCPIFLIDPTDLPYDFILHPDPDAPRVEAVKSGKEVEVDATIRGPLACLLAMLEGRIDGDALFFNRDLIIEGDTEAVVALRNAVDDAEISLKDDFLSLFGRFSEPAKMLFEAADRMAGMAARDLETLRQAVISPSMRRLENHEACLQELLDRLDMSTPNSRKVRKSRT